MSFNCCPFKRGKITKTNYFHFGNNSKTNKPGILVKLRTRKRQKNGRVTLDERRKEFHSRLPRSQIGRCGILVKIWT